MEIRVKITDYHIGHGSVRDMTFCPLALALDEATDIVWSVDFDRYYPAGFPRLARRLPPEIYKWVESYDHKLSPGPAEFEIDIPDTAGHQVVRIPWAEMCGLLDKHRPEVRGNDTQNSRA